MTEVICNDDDAACASSGLRSTVTWCSILGTTYYISVGYFASGVGTGNYVLGVTSAGTCLVLPIELVYFTAKRVENKVQIVANIIYGLSILLMPAPLFSMAINSL